MACLLQIEMIKTEKLTKTRMEDLHMKNRMVLFAQGLVIVMLILTVPLYGQGLIIDHTAVQKFDLIPDYWLAKAKELTIHYGHTSHGSQIMAGLNYLEANIDPDRYGITIRDRNPERVPDLPPQENHTVLRMREEGLFAETMGDKLGYWKGFEAQNGTRQVLDSGLFNVSGWAWCGEVANKQWPYIKEYLDVMLMYKKEYPNIKFFYMTGHNVEPGTVPWQQREYDRLHAHNDSMRTHCIKYNAILYDFADIEAWDIEGNYYPEEDASCVWCQDWVNNNPNVYQNIPPRSEGCGCGNISRSVNTHGLNSTIKGKAFWYMMARIAGWDEDVNTQVEVQIFEGHVIKEAVELIWRTTSIANNYGFEIQRSQKNASNFKKIGYVSGKEFDGTKNQFRFLDENVRTGIYFYRLELKNYDGSFHFSDIIQISISMPNEIRLYQNYPNPFNASTYIRYSLQQNAYVQLSIYDITSKEVHKLVDKFQNAGDYNLIWNANNLPSGQYFINLKADNFKETKRILFLK